MEMIDMLLHLQDLEHRCRELSKDEYVYKKDMEVLKMAKGVIWDKINENKLSEKNSDSDIITVKDMCGDEDFASLGFYVHLVWNNKDSYDPTIKPIWEGWIKDIPEEYMNYIVISTGRSVKDKEIGITGFYIYCEKEYTVYIKETLSKEVKVNATSDEEAFSIVNQMYTSGEIVLLADDVDGFEMGVVEQDNSEIIEDYAQL